MNEIGTQGKSRKKTGTLMVASVIIVIGVALWFLLSRGSRNERPVLAPTLSQPPSDPAAQAELEKQSRKNLRMSRPSLFYPNYDGPLSTWSVF